MSSPVQCPVKTVGLWVFGAIAGVLGVAPAAYAQGPPYTFEKVQFPGATYTDVTGINNSGVMVGTFSVGDGPTRGFRYDGTAYSPVDFPGATHSYALGINALGHIVGTHSFTGIDGPWHSYRLTDGDYIQFDVPGWESDARAINLAGNIVGAYNAGGVMPTHGYLRTNAGVYTLFDHPDAVYTLAWGLNDAGTVSGSFIDAAGAYRGFVYRQGSFSTLSYPGAFLTHAAGINNRNEVVGTQIQQAGAQHGFVLSEGGLRSFVVDFAGTTATHPLAINDAGQVVGTYRGARLSGRVRFRCPARRADAVVRSDHLPQLHGGHAPDGLYLGRHCAHDVGGVARHLRVPLPALVDPACAYVPTRACLPAGSRLSRGRVAPGREPVEHDRRWNRVRRRRPGRYRRIPVSMRLGLDVRLY